MKLSKKWKSNYNNGKIINYVKYDLNLTLYGDVIYIFIKGNSFIVEFWDDLEYLNEYFKSYVKNNNIDYYLRDGCVCLHGKIKTVKTIVNQFLVKMEKLNAFY
jgi:hypothetical protein